jgi:DNA (cytosine-5)-methyltransferase 1
MERQKWIGILWTRFIQFVGATLLLWRRPGQAVQCGGANGEWNESRRSGGHAGHPRERWRLSVVPDRFNILALCAGGGGLELGIELALPSARTVCVVEREGFACEILASAHENCGLGAPAGWTDMRTFDGRPWRGVVDCIAAGIPCQPHSVAGKRLGARDERNLWPDAARIIRECRPPFVFLENVGGAVSFFGEHVVGGLEGMGYRVEAGLFSAEEIGATHGRERLFVLAFSERAERGPDACGGRARTRRAVAGTERAGGEIVADAEHLSSRAGKPGIEGEAARYGRRGLSDEGAELADAIGEHDDSAGHGAGAVCRERPQASKVCEGVADAGGGECAGRKGERRNDGEERAAAPGSGLPLFPPGPADLDAWREVLANNPLLEPAIYGRLNPVFVEALMNWPAHFTDTRRPYDASDLQRWFDRTREVLCFLCCPAGTQAIRKEARGPGSVSSQKVLQPTMYGTRDVHPVSNSKGLGGARQKTEKRALRTLRHNRNLVHSPQEQAVVGQPTGKYLYALRILSHYFAPLKRRYCSEKTMASMSPLWVLDLWTECLQHLPDADKARWCAASQDNQEATVIAATEVIISASRVDRLSMLGNGVVPLAAAYAFATLLSRLELAMTGGPLLAEAKP